jgi:hypothetical protein
MKYVTSACLQRLLKCCKETMMSAVKEVTLRKKGKILDLDSYVHLRRRNAVPYVSFCWTEAILGVDLPQKVFDNEHFMTMYNAANDLIWLANVSLNPCPQKSPLTIRQDVYSFAMEQAQGQGGTNVLSVLMFHKKMDLQAASDYVGVLFDQAMDLFVTSKALLPSWGPLVDPGVVALVEGLGQYIVANIEFSFETERYFGSERQEVRRTRVVTVQSPSESPETLKSVSLSIVLSREIID